MKIPDSIRIGGVDFTVTSIPRLLSDDDTLLCGQIAHRNSAIQINSDISPDMQCISMLHEILHGIAAHAQLKLGEQEETIVDVFARGIYQVIQDNPDLMKP